MDTQSEPVREFRRQIDDNAAFLQTCDGGDPGTPAQPSIWLLGIEPGWSLADVAADAQGHVRDEELLQLYPVEMQLQWPFNRNAFKLLAAIEGASPKDYREFAMRTQPFVRGSAGYFKGNLFPVPFNNVGAWDDEAAARTGFATKTDYQTWVRAKRFPVIADWIDKCQPRLIIGCGLTHLHDFLAITGIEQPPIEHSFVVNGHTKRAFIATKGQIRLAVVPHLSGGIHSLNSYESIVRVAEILRTSMQG